MSVATRLATGTQQHVSRLALAVAALLLCAGGCEPGDASRRGSDAEAEDVGTSQTVRGGPVTMTLSATPADPDLSQHATVRLDIIAETGVTVTLDSYERALDQDENRFDYRIVESRQKQAVPTGDGRLRWSYECELEFVLPGEYELPAASLSYVDERTPPDRGGDEARTAAPHEILTLETEPLTLVVRQSSDEEPTIEELMTVATLDPIELPRKWSAWWWVGPTVGVALVALAILLIRRRQRRPEALVRISAHEWARNQLAALVAEDLIAKGVVQEFYYRISSIIRGYLERRFQVAAPEMTTEEFLASAAGDRRFGDDITTELTRFLSACDLVKYAKHQPSAAEPDALIHAAGDFVERTREQPESGDGHPPTDQTLKEHAA